MRRFLVLVASAMLLAGGCKKKAPPVEASATTADSPSLPAPPAQSQTTKLLKQLAKTKRADQLATAAQLADLAESDPAVIPGLLEALKDKTNLGEGQVLPNVPNSVREAAVMSLLRCGEDGEKAALDRGLPTLLGGLSDANSAVREHTLVAIARLGSKAGSAAPKVWPLAEDPSAFVRDAAYNCLRELGVKSPPQVVSLLSHTDAGVRLTAAEQLGAFKPLPADSVDPLRKALGDADKFIRTTAAECLLDFGAKAAPAAPDLAEAIRKNAKDAPPNGAEAIDFTPLNLLISIGASSVEPLGTLLAEKDPLILYQAVYALGEIGSPAKSTAEAIEKIMNRDGEDTSVRLEACRAHAAVTGDTAKAAPLLKVALEHKQAEVRSLGLQAVARLGALGRGLAPQVLPLLEDAEPVIRKFAIATTATLDAKGREAAVPLLAKRLKDDSASVRISAVNALADFGPLAAGAAGDLAAASADEDSDVRQTAIAALAELGPAGIAAKATLLSTVGDSKASDDLRSGALAAQVAIAPAAPETSAALLKLLDEKSGELRESAAHFAPRLKAASPAIIAKLAALAKGDPNTAVRTRATQALAEVVPVPTSIGDQLAALAKSPILELAQWAKIAQARSENRPADVTRIIRDGLQGPPGERLASVEALGKLISATATDFPGVDRLTRTKEAKPRQQAAEALGRFEKNASLAIPRLVELLQDRDEDVQFAAIRSLERFQAKDAATAVAPLKLKARGDTRIARAARRTLSKWDSADQ